MFRTIALAMLVTASPLLAEPNLARPCLAQAGEKQAPTLAPGDPAPALTIEKWVKGTPVNTFEKGKPYIVEFWATWCGPCIASMPPLSELQKEFGPKGLTVIGVTSKDANNTLEGVEKMVAAKGDGMGYTVAWDTERKTNAAWMKAAGRGGIPASFVVDGNGITAWIGHPMYLDFVIPDVVAGTWKVEEGGRKVAAIEKKLGAVYEKLGANDIEGALALLDGLRGEEPRAAEMLREVHFKLLLKSGKFADASTIGAELVDEAIRHGDPSALNQIAWTIVAPDEEWAQRDLDLAMRAAAKADELTGGKDWAIIDTLARVHACKHDWAKAIELQEKALRLAPSESARKDVQKALDEYKTAADEAAKG